MGFRQASDMTRFVFKWSVNVENGEQEGRDRAQPFGRAWAAILAEHRGADWACAGSSAQVSDQKRQEEEDTE